MSRLIVCALVSLLSLPLVLSAQEFPAARYNFTMFSLPEAGGATTDTIPTDVEETSGRMSLAFTFNPNQPQYAGIYGLGGTPTFFLCNGPTTWTSAQGINRHGDVAGWCFEDPLAATPVIKGYLRLASGQMILLEYPGAVHTEATDVNNHKNVLGIYIDATGVVHGFHWEFKTKRFTSIDVPFPGAVATTPLSMNNADLIVGVYHAPLGQLHGFFYDWRKKQFAGIDAPEAAVTVMVSINDFGVGIGAANNAQRGWNFVYEGGVFTEVDFPFAVPANGRIGITAINNSERIVGIVEIETPSPDPEIPPTVITYGFQAVPLPNPVSLARAQGRSVPMRAQMVMTDEMPAPPLPPERTFRCPGKLVASSWCR